MAAATATTSDVLTDAIPLAAIIIPTAILTAAAAFAVEVPGSILFGSGPAGSDAAAAGCRCSCHSCFN
jgi:hypothetical protein